MKSIENPSDADHEAILTPLLAYNEHRAGDPGFRPLAILLTNDGGAKVGGLWGKCAYDWLFVDLIVVPEEHRGAGYGKALMAEAERIARTNQCIGLWLDTFEFQARGFYERLGFEVFGTLDNHPIGQKRFFLRKHL